MEAKAIKGLEEDYSRCENPPVPIKHTHNHELRTSLSHRLLGGYMSRKSTTYLPRFLCGFLKLLILVCSADRTME